MSSRLPIGASGASEAAEARRLREWREERARVAEVEKQQRVAAIAEEREAQRKAEIEARRDEIRKLLPTQDSIEVARQQLAIETRHRARRLLLQALAIVGAPTLLVACYLTFVATPLFEATAVAAVSRLGNEPAEGISGLLSSFGGNTGLSQTFIASEYIRSDALAMQLEAESGLITQLASRDIDPLWRLRDLPLLGTSKLDRFSSFVTSSTDIQSGLITLHVFLPSAEQAVKVAERIVALTDDRVGMLADELYQQRLTLADQAVARAREDLRLAKADLAQLQIINAENDPAARDRMILLTINQISLDAQKLGADIAAAQARGGSDAAQLRQMQQREVLLDARAAQLQAELGARFFTADTSPDTVLLAYELALQEARISEQALNAALQAAAQVSQEAALGRNQFQVVVPPTLSRVAARPNVLRNTLLSFLLLLGLFSFSKLVLGTR